jgi:zinc/manganese transport system substrate-binding protein
MNTKRVDMRSSVRRIVIGIAFASAVLGLNPARAADAVPVVVTFSILADLTRAVGQERIRVHALVGPDGDAHVYQPTPADAKLLGRARLVVTNGLGFEGWMDRLVSAVGYRGEIVVASHGVRVLKATKSDRGGGHHHHGGIDPHAWQDIENVKRYVTNIEAGLSRVDPAGAAAFRANAAAYIAQLAALDAEIRATLGSLPPERRRVVTSHDAFGYFARAYGMQFFAARGGSNEAEPSAAGVAALIRQIKAERVPAVFIENITDTRLLERVRVESGARLGGTLYSDALSAPDGPAATYLDMMRHNVRTIATALAP